MSTFCVDRMTWSRLFALPTGTRLQLFYKQANVFIPSFFFTKHTTKVHIFILSLRRNLYYWSSQRWKLWNRSPNVKCFEFEETCNINFVAQLLYPSQIISCFGFSRSINFIMHLDIIQMQMRIKVYEYRKTKTTNNLGRGKYHEMLGYFTKCSNLNLSNFNQIHRKNNNIYNTKLFH